MRQEVPAEEEFLAWLEDPVTQKFRKLLSSWLDSLKDQWVAGRFLSESVEETALMNAGAAGEADVLKRLMELDYEQFAAGLSDE